MQLMVKIMFSFKHVKHNGVITILCYHNVLVEEDPFRPQAITVKTLEQHLKIISKYFKVFTVEDALNLHKSGQLPFNALAITFDDGFHDNFENAFPLLKKYSLPASFYITGSGTLGKNFWKDELTYALKNTVKKHLDLSSVGINKNNLTKEMPLETQEDKLQVQSFLFAYLTKQNIIGRNELFDNILAYLGTELSPRLMMTEEQIRVLSECGMEIGSHGIEHQPYIQLSDSEINVELIDSKAMLESIINKPVVGFAYPYGKPKTTYDQKTDSIVCETGYQYSLSTLSDVSNFNHSCFSLQRYTLWKKSSFSILLGLIKNHLMGYIKK